MITIFQYSRIFSVLAVAAFLAGCGTPEVTSEIYDPFEEQNRKFHKANRNLDGALLRPASQVYGGVLPESARIGVGNFASNLSLPGNIANDLLQLNLRDALHNTFRLVVNTTVGIGGIFDPASESGVEQRSSDFGETLHVWGFKEGPYLELAFLGPSTARDTVGMAVDFFFDPIGLAIPAPERYVATLASAASTVGDRYRFSDTYDSILYESEDSYSQARLLYLENRRFQLGQGSSEAEDELYDLYEESYE